MDFTGIDDVGFSPNISGIKTTYVFIIYKYIIHSPQLYVLLLFICYTYVRGFVLKWGTPNFSVFEGIPRHSQFLDRRNSPIQTIIDSLKRTTCNDGQKACNHGIHMYYPHLSCDWETEFVAPRGSLTSSLLTIG